MSDRRQRLGFGHDPAQGAVFVQVAERLDADGLVQAATLALAAATARAGADDRAWTDAAGPKLPPTRVVSAP